MNEDLAISLAEEFAEYRRWWTAPPGSHPVRPYGLPMDGPLAALSPVTPETIGHAVKLQLMYLNASVDRLRAAWRRLPPEFRKQVMAQFEELDHGGEDWVWRAVEDLDLLPR